MIRLISKTQSAVEDIPNDIKELIAYVARVSNPMSQAAKLKTDKLIKYLENHKHWSPFDMADLTYEIETTRDIARQMLRHLSFKFQEFSQRYADPHELGWSFREARLQDTKNRQNSIEIDDPVLQKEWIQQQKRVMDAASSAYRWAIGKDIAMEVARAVLPEGLINSRMYMKGSVRSWIHYLQVRQDPTTQKEHRDVAGAISKEFAKEFDLTE